MKWLALAGSIVGLIVALIRLIRSCREEKKEEELGLIELREQTLALLAESWSLLQKLEQNLKEEDLDQILDQDEKLEWITIRDHMIGEGKEFVSSGFEFVRSIDPNDRSLRVSTEQIYTQTSELIVTLRETEYNFTRSLGPLFHPPQNWRD